MYAACKIEVSRKARRSRKFLFSFISFTGRVMYFYVEKGRELFSKKKVERWASIHARSLFSLVGFDGTISMSHVRALSGLVKHSLWREVSKLAVDRCSSTHNQTSIIRMKRKTSASGCMWINKKKSWKVIRVAEREKQHFSLWREEKKKSYKRLLTLANGAEPRAPFSIEKLKIINAWRVCVSEVCGGAGAMCGLAFMERVLVKESFQHSLNERLRVGFIAIATTRPRPAISLFCNVLSATPLPTTTIAHIFSYSIYCSLCLGAAPSSYLRSFFHWISRAIVRVWNCMRNLILRRMCSTTFRTCLDGALW